MKITKKLSMGFKLCETKLFKKRQPLIVSWVLTYKCNRSCIYCDSWRIKPGELSTKEVISIIDEMSQAGTQRLHFSGGEPLLRDDIGLILEHCNKKNITTDINSNGSSVTKKINELTTLDLLSISLDGREKIHDSIRGAGSYKEAMEAAQLIKQKGLKTRFITVLSKLNLGEVGFILKKATELKTPVVFQPARMLTLTGICENPIAPSGNDYKRVIAELMIEKRKNKYICNSLSGLTYLYNWPNPTMIKCINSLIVCRLEPNGDLYGCGNLHMGGNISNCIKVGFKKAFKDLTPACCKECWCASYVELNCLFSLKPDAILNIIKLI